MAPRGCGKAVWRGMAVTLVRYPCTVCTFAYMLTLMLTVIAFGLFDFVIDTGSNSFQVREHPTRYNEDTMRVVLRETDYLEVRAASVVPERVVPKYALTLMLTVPRDVEDPDDSYIAEGRDGNVFTEEGLDVLRRAERLVVESPGYEDFCALQVVNATTGEMACMAPLSPTTLFYSDLAAGTRTPGTIEQTLRGLCSQVQTVQLLNSFVSSEFECGGNFSEGKPQQLRSVATRSTIFFGAPLAGYTNVDDDSDAQDAKFDEWILGLELDAEDRIESRLMELAEEEQDDYKLVWLGSGLTSAEFDRVITNDGAFAFGAIVAVGAYILFHTRTIFLTVFGMAHVLLSFSTGHFIMRVVLAVPTFSMLNVLSIFIILGIGADDIFIFLDAWKQGNAQRIRHSKFRDEYGRVIAVEDELLPQMELAHKRATYAMLVTSVTTAFAFAANAFSLIPPIRLFGQFTAIIVVLNFLLVISCFPAMVVLYERWFAQKTYKEILCCCLPMGAPKQREEPAPVAEEELDSASSSSSDSDGHDGGRDAERGAETAEERRARKEVVITEENIKNYRLLERFFFGPYSDALNKVKFVVIVFFVALGALAAVGATQLEPASEPARFLPDDYPIQIFLDLEAEVFKQSELVSQVQFGLGVSELDVEGVDTNDPESVGKVVYNPDFAGAMSSAAGQAIFDSICDGARRAEFTRINALGQPEVLCFTDVMRSYLRAQANDSSVGLPTGAAFVPALLDFVDNYRYPTPATASLFDQLPRGYDQTVRFLDSPVAGAPRQLVFASVVVNTTLNPNDPASKVTPIYDAYQKVVDDTVDLPNFPSGFDGLFQTSDRYPRAQTELVLLETAITGIILSLILSAVVISIFTRNVVLTPLIIVSVAGIVVTMLGLVWAVGWTLGIIESICITILTGLSIDYVVHLGIAINDSHASGRFNRVRGGLTTMGISVLSAALTTIFASLFLLGTTVLFFVRFGIFLLMTIVTATFWSFVFFTATAFAAAPSSPGHCGIPEKCRKSDD